MRSGTKTGRGRPARDREGWAWPRAPRRPCPIPPPAPHGSSVAGSWGGRVGNEARKAGSGRRQVRRPEEGVEASFLPPHLRGAPPQAGNRPGVGSAPRRSAAGARSAGLEPEVGSTLSPPHGCAARGAGGPLLCLRYPTLGLALGLPGRPATAAASRTLAGPGSPPQLHTCSRLFSGRGQREEVVMGQAANSSCGLERGVLRRPLSRARWSRENAAPPPPWTAGARFALFPQRGRPEK